MKTKSHYMSNGFWAGSTGLEPAISGLTGRRVNQTTPRSRLFTISVPGCHFCLLR